MRGSVARARRIAIRPLAVDEVDALIALAGTIWRRHYAGIIESAQIEYMLAERYRPDILRRELAAGDVWWDVLAVDDTPRGFSSCFLTEQPQRLKLDKLYLHPDEQRAGYGKRMLQHVLARGRALGCRQLMLAVNKRNVDAIAAYGKWGFAVEQATVTGIGGGFVMDDYIMVRPMDP